jgi:hypothetical protein
MLQKATVSALLLSCNHRANSAACAEAIAGKFAAIGGWIFRTVARVYWHHNSQFLPTIPIVPVAKTASPCTHPKIEFFYFRSPLRPSVPVFCGRKIIDYYSANFKKRIAVLIIWDACVRNQHFRKSAVSLPHLETNLPLERTKLIDCCGTALVTKGVCRSR